MSNLDEPSTATPRRHRLRCLLDSISLPDGEVLVPRATFARSLVGISDRTANRMNLPTVYISGTPYVKRDASLRILADKAQRKNQPRKPRRASAA